MSRNNFQFYFGYGSLIPLFIFLLGIYIIYLFLNNFVSYGILIMLTSLILYILNNVLDYILNINNEFNQYLEDFALYLTFGVSTIIYGVKYFSDNYFFLVIVFFYSACILLSLARNSILDIKNTYGWPIALNGLFFPIIYYYYEFYLGIQGSSIFMLFYIIVGILSISTINFIGTKNKKTLSLLEEKRDGKIAKKLYNEMLETNYKKKK